MSNEVKYELSQELFATLLKYLIGKPFHEVNNLINALHKVPMIDDSKEEDKEQE